jgi:hypothetical protein
MAVEYRGTEQYNRLRIDCLALATDLVRRLLARADEVTE